MKAALGDAKHDHVLCKCLGRASPGSQPKVPDPARDGPAADPAAGTNPGSAMALFVGTRLLSRPQYKTEP